MFSRSRSGAVTVVLAAIAAAAATGAAFASWMDQAAAIYMATVDAGLSWCF